MNDSYTRHKCGITSFTPTRKSRLVDLLILAAGFGLLALKIYTVYKGLTS